MKNPLTLILLLTVNIILVAQSGKTIECAVLEESAVLPLAYATVSILSGDSLIDGMITDQEGKFSINISPEATHLEIRAIGYETSVIEKSEVAEQNDHCQILLEISNWLQEDVEVTADRSSTEYKIDRKVIHLGSDIQSSGTTALEAFDQLTEIQTDLSSGTISLRGNDNVRILVNGKPSSLGASDLLTQIPSSTIDRIEIISSPSARYQADGLSGIVNIMFKKEQTTGLNIKTNGTIGTKRGSLGIQGNYNLTKLNLEPTLETDDYHKMSYWGWNFCFLKFSDA